jgi:hypothetical protein
MDQEIRSRAEALHTAVAEGRLLEAFDEYYAENVAMREGSAEPTVGKAANRAREEAWLATVAEFRGYEVKAIAVDGDVSFVETVMDYVDQDGNAVHGEQVARALWSEGRIVDERFYSA